MSEPDDFDDGPWETRSVNLGMPAYGFDSFVNPIPRTEGFWHACRDPERQPDPWVMWHYRGCVGCAIKASASVLQWPDDANVQRILGPIARQFDELAR